MSLLLINIKGLREEGELSTINGMECRSDDDSTVKPHQEVLGADIYQNRFSIFFHKEQGCYFSIHSGNPCMLHSSRIQIMPARQPAIQLRSNSPLFPHPSSTPFHLPCKPLLCCPYPPNADAPRRKQTVCSRD